MKRRRQKSFGQGRLAARRLACALACAAMAAPLLWFGAARLLPFPNHLLLRPSQNLRLLDRDGNLLRRTLSVDGLDTYWLPLAECGDWSAAALLSIEDQRFYLHSGVDPGAVVRAFGQNLRNRRVVSGASTISTQLIRLVEPRPRTFSSKVVEAFRATQLELRYDKEFILEQYLNRAPFGGNRKGLATAARRYYGKEARHLAAGEAALLAGLPQSPSRFRPDRHAELAEQRRETVLRRMREEKVLETMPWLEFGPRWRPPPLRAPHFTDWLLRRHRGRDGDLTTTLDSDLQSRLEQVVAAARQDPLYRELDGIGLVVIEPATGAIRAWVGGWDYAHPQHGQVDCVTRPRAPGSTLKPLAYALAMQQGWLTPKTMLVDRAMAYADYRPRNMSRQADGKVTARDALVRSLNLPAIALVERIGLPDWFELLGQAGIGLPAAVPANAGLGSVIGGGLEVSLLELTAAYSAFANRGVLVAPRGVEQEKVETLPLFHPGVAWWITDILSGRERDFSLYGHLAETERPALAFKTGTSNGHRDGWAVGWNGDWLIGVWLGRMDNRAVHGLAGASHAVPMLGAIVEVLPGHGKLPRRPPQLIELNGREIIAGITDPAAQPKPNQSSTFAIVSPPPDYELHVWQNQEVRLPLRTAGRPHGQVHWFVNGERIGEHPAGQAWSASFVPGRHELRAVHSDGSAHRLLLTIVAAKPM